MKIEGLTVIYTAEDNEGFIFRRMSENHVQELIKKHENKKKFNILLFLLLLIIFIISFLFDIIIPFNLFFMFVFF